MFPQGRFYFLIHKDMAGEPRRFAPLTIVLYLAAVIGVCVLMEHILA